MINYERIVHLLNLRGCHFFICEEPAVNVETQKKSRKPPTDPKSLAKLPEIPQARLELMLTLLLLRLLSTRAERCKGF